MATAPNNPFHNQLFASGPPTIPTSNPSIGLSIDIPLPMTSLQRGKIETERKIADLIEEFQHNWNKNYEISNVLRMDLKSRMDLEINHKRSMQEDVDFTEIQSALRLVAHSFASHYETIKVRD